MNKLYLFVWFLLFFFSGQSQTKSDTLLSQQGQKIDNVVKSIGSLKADIDTIKTSNKKNAETPKTDPCGSCEIGCWQWVLIFSPAWIFLTALLAIRKKLKDFSLKEALSESELPRKTIPNPEYSADKLKQLAENATLSGVLASLVPPTIEVTDGSQFPKSSSRYIAFITSALTWIIVLCMSCFFIYQYIKTGKSPELNNLSTIMLSLGIGVVPYAFNKVSAAIK